MKLQRISPCLWFDDNAEEAANFYVSIFANSKLTNVSRYGEVSPPGRKGSVMMVSFELDGLHMLALNGGPMFKFSEAVSMSVACEDQAEVDYFWNKLVDGGTPSQCGWLKDRFGLSWQIVPRAIERIMTGDPAGAQRALQKLMGMVKLDVAELERAARG